MDHKNLLKLLKNIKIPVAYDHFPDNKNLEPPFMAYREKANDTFNADNTVFIAFPNFEIELVTNKKDIDLENEVAKLLIDNDIPFEKPDPIWDNEEKIYHIFYEI